MSKLTITEALAEIKTIGKRLEKKRQFIQQNLARVEMVRDPLEAEGGSVEVVRRERQAYADLTDRIVFLRAAIHAANARTPLTINGTTRTVAAWIVWRRDAVPLVQQLHQMIRAGLQNLRAEVGKRGVRVVEPSVSPEKGDIIVHLAEGAFAQEMETLEDTLGQLDGKLSLLNAQITVEE